jgi:ubiquitin C-terminal hydrolase
MNAILQCITHTPLFKNYFHDQLYKYHVNPKRSSSAPGYFAELMAEFIKAYVDGVSVTTTLRKVKDGVGVYIPQFQGYDQHDAQEVSFWS